MENTQSIIELLSDKVFLTVALGSLILGAVSGALGGFAFLRKQSLIGDVVAHSSLAGITIFFAVYFLITGDGNRNTLFLMAGAFASGILSMFSIDVITRYTRIKSDAAMGIMLSVYFATGVFVLSLIRNLPIPGKAGLEDFIFGMAASMTNNDIIYMASIGILVLIVLIIFWKEIKVQTFDLEFAESIGFPHKKINLLVNILLVLSIVIGLHAVGVILMVSLLVAPGSAARQWTDNLAVMTVLSSVFGMLSGLTGAVFSSINPSIPTGPVIVLTATSIVMVSIFLSPKRGLLLELIKRIKNRKRIKLSIVLIDLYLLNLNHELDRNSPHSSRVLEIMNSSHSNVNASLKYLRELGYVQQVDKDFWLLTDSGVIKAEQIMKIRGELL